MAMTSLVNSTTTICCERMQSTTDVLVRRLHLFATVLLHNGRTRTSALRRTCTAQPKLAMHACNHVNNQANGLFPPAEAKTVLSVSDMPANGRYCRY